MNCSGSAAKFDTDFAAINSVNEQKTLSGTNFRISNGCVARSTFEIAGRKELLFPIESNEKRPHQSLGYQTPASVYFADSQNNQKEGEEPNLKNSSSVS